MPPSGQNGDRLTKLLVGQETLTGDIKTLTARVEAHMSRTSEQSTVLFEQVAKHDQRIGEIEKDYVTENTFSRHKTTNRQEHTALQDKVQDARLSMAVIFGILAVAGGGVGLFKMFGG